MPVQFICPYCGATTNVADQYIGQSGPCAHCGKTITVTALQAGAPFGGGNLTPRRGLSTGWVIFIVLACVGAVLLVCGGILATLQLPAVGAAREAARRMACVSNLRQIGLAIHNYAEANSGYLPPAYVADKNGKPLYSWRVLILPYLDGERLYQQFHFDEPWDSTHNRTLIDQMPACFRCPSAFGQGGTTTSYAMLVGPHALGNGAKPRKFSDIKDGTSRTIMVVEAVGAGIPWTAPTDIDAADALPIQEADVNKLGANKGISGCHAIGVVVNVLLCDVAVRAIHATADEKTLRAMITIDGGETVKDDGD